MPALTLRYLDSPREVPAAEWDALVPRHAFTSHAWLCALEAGPVVGAGRSMQFRIPVLMDAAGRLMAAAPAVLKRALVGNYGPENEWVRQAARQGVSLLPKLHIEVPLAPVALPKFLLRPGLPYAATVQALLAKVIETASAAGIPALTLARMVPEELAVARAAGLLLSNELGSFWHNDGYACHDDFLARMKSDQRHQIRKERRAVRATGLEVRELRGREITPALWDAFFAGHVAVCERKKSGVLYSRLFFDQLASLGDAVWLVAAFRGERFVCGTFKVQSGRTLYSRSWSELEPVPLMVFELCVHRPLSMAIALGLDAVDAGVWQPYKRTRGVQPVALTNAHWFRDAPVRALASSLSDAYRDAVAPTLVQARALGPVRAEETADA